MTAHWMLYVLAVGVLVSLGALAMERAMRAFALPQRWVWAAAMVLGLAIPAAARWLPRGTELVAAARPATAQDAGAPAADGVAAVAEIVPRVDLAALDGPLLVGWLGSGLVALLILGGASLLLARRRRGWRAAEVDGVPVLLSPGTGPAVVGLFRSRIVLPAWVMDAHPAERALLLEHEREHLRAGDPKLLALGLLAVALAPWNVAAWYGLRRLRLAVEIDCDARVLARRDDVRAYGTLLLEVGRRASMADRLIAAAAFSEPASFLERRIRVMTSPRARRPLLRAAGFGAVAVGLTVAACEAPGPAHPSRTETAAAQAITPREALDRFYPELVRGVGDSATVILVYAPEGTLLDHRMSVAGKRGQRRQLPGWASRPANLEMANFPAGEVGPQPVRVFTLRQLGPEAAARLENAPTETVITTTVPTSRTGGRP
jgi:beta-lactamase regulating signal transducer with metallopeptidase domain